MSAAIYLKEFNLTELKNSVDVYKRQEDGVLLAKIKGEKEWQVASKISVFEEQVNWNCNCGSYLELGGWCSNCGYAIPQSSIQDIMDSAE